jgi:hypothetical protein
MRLTLTNGSSPGYVLEGVWPGASSNLWLTFDVWVIQDNGRDVFVSGLEGQPLADFQNDMIADYSASVSSLTRPSKRHRLVCDYEIWDGEPGKGILVKKDSVFSAWRR